MDELGAEKCINQSILLFLGGWSNGILVHSSPQPPLFFLVISISI